jgi:hypothetical protein
MAWLVRSLLLACLLAAGACSMESAINKLSSAEDRAFAQQFVEDVRRGNSDRLKPLFDSEQWALSEKQLINARSHFPKSQGEAKLISYHVATNLADGVRDTRKEYSLVTTDGARWTVVRIATQATGGPAKVVAWRVDGYSKPPPELAAFDMMNRIAPWLQAGAALLLIGVIAFILWLVRRSRRRSAGVA